MAYRASIYKFSAKVNHVLLLNSPSNSPLFHFLFFLYNNEKKLQDDKKTTVHIKLETALPQDTMVMSPGVQPRKEKVTKKRY